MCVLLRRYGGTAVRYLSSNSCEIFKRFNNDDHIIFGIIFETKSYVLYVSFAITIEHQINFARKFNKLRIFFLKAILHVSQLVNWITSDLFLFLLCFCNSILTYYTLKCRICWMKFYWWRLFLLIYFYFAMISTIHRYISS